MEALETSASTPPRRSRDPYPADQEPAVGWLLARDLWAHRRLIAGVTVAVALLAAGLSLLLPNQYRAGARVLMPDTGGGGLAALLGRSPSAAAASLLGGGQANYTRYLAILTSTTVYDRTIEAFDLKQVYDVKPGGRAQELARAELEDRLDFTIDAEYDFLSISYLDEDPQRAADVANFLVDELNRINGELAVENAALFRRYAQQRYEESLLSLDSLRLEMRQFQEQYGVIELSASAQAFLEALAVQQAAVAELEVRLAALREQYGPGSDREPLRMAEASLRQARRQVRDLTEGREDILPVPLQRLPEAAAVYARLYQDIQFQVEVLKVVQPLYEQARFEEERLRTAVQVLDPARPPARKAEPRRSILVLAAALSAALATAALVLLRLWLRAHQDEIRRTLSS